MSAAEATRLRGNSLYARSEFQAAREAYTLAADQLHRPRPVGADMPLATILANRAAACLTLSSSCDAADACVDDCAAALDAIGGDPAGDALSAKLRHRQRMARSWQMQHAAAGAADRHAASGQWSAAVSGYAEALSIHRRRKSSGAAGQAALVATLERRRGVALCRVMRFDDAVAAFESALQADPTDVEARERRGAAARAASSLRGRGAADEPGASTPVLPVSLGEEQVTILFSTGGPLLETAPDRFENVARAAPDAALCDIDDADASDALPAGVGRLDLRLKLLPLSIGGKLWDASVLLAAWLAERGDLLLPADCAGGRKPRVLELGCGIGVTGLAAAKLLPWDVTISDYEPELLDCLRESCATNFEASAAGLSPAPPAVSLVDFRDFTVESLQQADEALAERRRVAGPLCRYAEEGLLHTFDLVFGSDIVYDSYHGQLAQVILATLRPPTACPDGAEQPTGRPAWTPQCVLLLPDGRPRQAEFVAAVLDAGLDCRIERILPGCDMMRTLRRVRPGWGTSHNFSLYFISVRGGSAAPPSADASHAPPPRRRTGTRRRVREARG